MTTSTRQTLIKARETVLARLRAKEPDLVRELEALEQAISALGGELSISPSPSATLYTGIKDAIDAIVKHLELIGHTLPPDELAQAVANSGWLTGNPYASRNARGSITYHVEHTKNTKKIKKFSSGRIGLYEWDNARDQLR